MAYNNNHKLNQFVIASAGTAGLDVTLLLLFSPQHQGLPFASGGQSIGVSALASVLPMNIQG